MPQNTGVKDQYKELIPSLRSLGYTLQEIGDKCNGVSRERIRQILKKHYAGVKPVFPTELQVAKSFGVATYLVTRLRETGKIHPIKHTSFYRYNPEDLPKIKELLARSCKHCGNPLPKRHKHYCKTCSNEVIRYRYPFMSDEERGRFFNMQLKWGKNNPDKKREIQKRASRKYQLSHPKWGKVFWDKKPLYNVVMGERKGDVVTGVGREKQFILLSDGTKLAWTVVRRVK